MRTRTKEVSRVDRQVRMPNVGRQRKQTAKKPPNRRVTLPPKEPTPFDLEPVQRRELPARLRARREAYACTKEIPGHDAPEFDLLTGSSSIRGLPSVDSMLPTYLLDSNYRILDWNDAFALVFDRTMEGRRGMNVLEWTFFLDTFEEVLDHGAGVFGDPHSLPAIDIETIRYTSRRYGKISAVKRAYRVPDDRGDCAGWLVCLEPDFADRANAKQFLMELVTTRQRNLMWSEYAMSYDMVLTNTTVYPELIDTILGEKPPLTPIPPEARVLDLGAGTGNIACMPAGAPKGISS